jgi:hypothetical protein
MALSSRRGGILNADPPRLTSTLRSPVRAGVERGAEMERLKREYNLRESWRHRAFSGTSPPTPYRRR